MMGSWSAAGVADQSVTVLTGIKERVGENAKVITPKGRTSPTIKASSTFLNLYEKRCRSIRARRRR
jgi:beta-glucosidase